MTLGGERELGWDGADEFRLGWRSLVAATLGTSMATTAIPFYSLGAFVTPLEHAKGWSRGDISFAATLVGFGLPLSLLLVGYMIDRFGLRLVAASGHLALGFGFIALSLVGHDVRHFWVIYALIGLVGVGASPITFTRALIGLFDRRRGIAIGICLAGAGLGAAVAPPLLTATISKFGWASAYLLLGVFAFCLVPLALTWLPPMDQISKRSGVSVGSPSEEGVRPTHPALLLTLICVLFFAIALSINGFIVHLLPLLIDGGASPSQAAWIAGLVGIAVIVGRIGTGLLLDRVPVVLLGGGIFAMASIGILLLDIFSIDWAALSALLIGLSIGAEVDLAAYLVSRRFKPEDYSRRFGIVYSAFMLGSGISPLVAGWVFDGYGNYSPFIRLASLLLALVSIIFLALHIIRHRYRGCIRAN